MYDAVPRPGAAHSWGSGSPEEIISSPTVVDEDNGMGTMERRKTTGQILWIRGLTRLQTQVGFPRRTGDFGDWMATGERELRLRGSVQLPFSWVPRRGTLWGTVSLTIGAPGANFAYSGGY